MCKPALDRHMGAKYHVAVSKEGSTSSIDLDKERDWVISEIVKPYNDFTDFWCEGRLFHPAYISQILILRTDEETDVLQKQAQTQYKLNSEKWNNIVKEKGKDVQKLKEELTDLGLNKYKPLDIENYKFAQQSILINSIKTINDFCKIMITLVSGFFAVYFALLKFLGLEKIGDNDLLYVPPILFILSIIALIIGANPQIYFSFDRHWSWKSRKYEELSSEARKQKIDDFRKNILEYKYIPMIIGMGLFVVGLFFTLWIGISLL